MIQTIKTLFLRYKALILYVFFGGCTTLVNIVSYYVCAHILSMDTMASTVLAWILSVLFAYVTNRKWVFESKENTTSGIIQEIIRFFGSRLATGAVDWLAMFVFVELLHWNDMIVKIAANIVVIILNYIASKLFVFSKKGERS